MEVFEVLGTISFALSGAMLGVEKKADLFGVLFLGIITATGGGVLRDILLGQLPPHAFADPSMILVAAATALALFLVAWRMKEQYSSKGEQLAEINAIFDSMGLAAFTVTGTEIAISAGYGDNLLFAVTLGMTTAVGGGILRDVLVNDLPYVMKKHVYAVASICGALCYILLRGVMPQPSWAASLSFALVYIIRILARRFRWNLPRA